MIASFVIIVFFLLVLVIGSIMINSTEKVSPKHVFLHLFVIIMLYAATINFLTLVFQYTNVWVPDPLADADYYSYNNYLNIIRFGLAAFIVIFPVFILTSWFLNKSYLKNPAVKDMKIRKWLIYFTLFIAALVIIGDLVRIVLVFLEGELTLRIIIKALSVLVVTGVIFGYYLWDVKRTKPFKNHRYFVWLIIIVAIIAIAAGFFIIGSPQKERLRRFDQQKIDNLNEIQNQIVDYWRRTERLPETLAALENEISGYKAPNDPQSKEPYEYKVKGELIFELCAVFNLTSEEAMPNILKERIMTLSPLPQNWNWEHEVGKTCFERTIDKELYPPYEENIPVKPLMD